MGFAALNELRAYWEALRDGHRVPRRSAVDPRGLSGVLEQALLLERIAPGIARFRVAGVNLIDLMGMEVRGMPLSALIAPAGRGRLAEGLEQVFAAPAILTLDLEAERSFGRPALSGRMMLLPLCDDAGRTLLAIGALVTEGEPGRAPRRFAIARMSTERLGPPTIAAPRVMELSEAAAPYVGPLKAAERPYLRLVHTAD